MAKSAKTATAVETPQADPEMVALLADSGAADEPQVDTVESLTAVNEQWAEYADELQKQLDAQTAIVQALQKQLDEANATKAKYEAQHGRATEGAALLNAAQVVVTAAVAMAGHLPQDVSKIPTVDQINAAGKK